MRSIRVWDLPLRLFHWLLVLLVTGSIVTGELGGAWMEWHGRFGYLIIALLVFRIVWGVAGPVYARFASFVTGPSELVAYLKGLKPAEPQRQVGHTPLGAQSIVAMLLALLAQAISGLFANDEIAFDGPLVRFISRELSETFSWYHTEVNFKIVIVLLALHVGAIVVFRLRGKKLVGPMITGEVESDAEAPDTRDDLPMRLFALAALLAGFMLVWWISVLGTTQ